MGCTSLELSRGTFFLLSGLGDFSLLLNRGTKMQNYGMDPFWPIRRVFRYEIVPLNIWKWNNLDQRPSLWGLRMLLGSILDCAVQRVCGIKRNVSEVRPEEKLNAI